MRILRYADLKPEKGIPFTREHLRRLEEAGRFPKRVRFTESGYHGWIETEVDDFLAQRAAARDGEAA